MHHEGVLLGYVEAEMARYDCWRFFIVAIWSAFLLAVGNFCYASTGGSLGYAISYSLSRGTLLVSALWGIFSIMSLEVRIVRLGLLSCPLSISLSPPFSVLRWHKSVPVC